MLIHEAVIAAARRHPDTVALVDGDGGEVTYARLSAGVHALATTLVDRTPAHSRIAIDSRKTPATITAMLAVLHAGRAYVPVDPSAPPARRDFILGQASCALMLSDSPAQLGGLDIPVVDLNAALAENGVDTAVAPEPVVPRPDLDDIAYILYTSGSTGQPKGVVITHRNARAFVDWAVTAFPLRPGDQVAVHAPLHFDVPVYDVYAGLRSGATVQPVPEKAALFPQAFHRFLVDRRISHLYAVPSALTALVNRSTATTDGLPDLRRLLYAGEEFQPKPLAALMAAAPNATVSNLYGPIETNVVTRLTLDGPPELDHRIPLGHGIDGTVVGLLGADGSLSLDGAAEGEIVVAGECVTPGYLDRPDLTAAAMTDLDTGTGRRRFYRTGDIGRRDGEGVLHILGRRDFMVKTRGYRVELGDVEGALDAHPAVADVAVVAIPDEAITHRLHAVVVPSATISAGSAAAPPATAPPAAGHPLATDLLAHCRQRLPAYMVPGAIHITPDLPRTSTGKIARHELAALVASWTETTDA